jgi:hypothetical protein
MASEQQVKQYIAHWFQLGRKVLSRNGKEAFLPEPVIQGDRYSYDFERCWQLIISPNSGDCYLEGTDQRIAELLTPAWDIRSCACCAMPIPFRNAGMPPSSCPCHEISTWPNLDVPAPRLPVDSQEHLNQIRDRLLKANNH